MAKPGVQTVWRKPVLKGRRQRITEVAPKIIKLDIGSLTPEQAGFTKLSREDMLRFPWPYPDESLDEAIAVHSLQYVPARMRGDLMDELYRTLKTGAKATIIVPYWSSSRSVHDWKTEWPPLCEQSFLFFNKAWRDAQSLKEGYGNSDFDFTYGYAEDPELAARSSDSKPFWVKHYIGVINDVHVVLTKRAVVPTDAIPAT